MFTFNNCFQMFCLKGTIPFNFSIAHTNRDMQYFELVSLQDCWSFSVINWVLYHGLSPLIIRIKRKVKKQVSNFRSKMQSHNLCPPPPTTLVLFQSFRHCKPNMLCSQDYTTLQITNGMIGLVFSVTFSYAVPLEIPAAQMHFIHLRTFLTMPNYSMKYCFLYFLWKRNLLIDYF